VNVLYGWAHGREGVQCAFPAGEAAVALCGARVQHMPPVQPPYSPANLHDVCRDAVWGSWNYQPGVRAAALADLPADLPAEPVLQPMGECPVCGGHVCLDNGVVVPHGAWVVRGGRVLVSETPCDGKGMPPVEEP
jgi:hypothetical protein